MPDVSLTEALIAAVLTLGGVGGAVAAARRKPLPGTPEDHEQRIGKLEANDRGCNEHLANLEARMSAIEKEVAGIVGALAPLTVSMNRLTDSIDGLEAKLTELDIEARVERELKRRHRSKSDTDPDKE